MFWSIFTTFFYFSRESTLKIMKYFLPYSFMMAVDYFKARYPDTTVIFDMSVVYVTMAFFAVFANNILVETVSLNKRITFGKIAYHYSCFSSSLPYRNDTNEVHHYRVFYKFEIYIYFFSNDKFTISSRGSPDSCIFDNHVWSQDIWSRW